MIDLFYYDFPHPVGRLGIQSERGWITRVFSAGLTSPLPEATSDTELLHEAALQLEEYFAGKRRTFDLPLAPLGTRFQTRVWETLRAIPYGETRSYREIAEQVNSPRGFQAIGQANTHNPLPFFIPCHRVIAADGTPGGYALGSELKEWLLALERDHC